MTKYYTISLPEKIIKSVDKAKQQLPFTSRADFVKQAIRNELQRVKV